MAISPGLMLKNFSAALLTLRFDKDNDKGKEKDNYKEKDNDKEKGNYKVKDKDKGLMLKNFSAAMLTLRYCYLHQLLPRVGSWFVSALTPAVSSSQSRATAKRPDSTGSPRSTSSRTILKKNSICFTFVLKTFTLTLATRFRHYPVAQNIEEVGIFF